MTVVLCMLYSPSEVNFWCLVQQYSSLWYRSWKDFLIASVTYTRKRQQTRRRGCPLAATMVGVSSRCPFFESMIRELENLCSISCRPGEFLSCREDYDTRVFCVLLSAFYTVRGKQSRKRQNKKPKKAGGASIVSCMTRTHHKVWLTFATNSQTA